MSRVDLIVLEGFSSSRSSVAIGVLYSVIRANLRLASAAWKGCFYDPSSLMNLPEGLSLEPITIPQQPGFYFSIKAPMYISNSIHRKFVSVDLLCGDVIEPIGSDSSSVRGFRRQKLPLFLL